ncbi:hypothetical protein [Streptomyces sp. 891-h]|uniref:hypothetical protein n=1 Tax=Streptomyces sp. 891-h TaxID=2720714 RepID=UPI001FAA0B89|nr:hypothetical protein [Streptomyces sp. 891-h]UNZ18487.1 hypothetical protein HC362_17010 [Streptomyces sp. 891-h]
MHQPQQRSTSRLRAVTLASTVALAVALVLAVAVAGQDARLATKAFQAAHPRHTDDHAREAHPSDVRPAPDRSLERRSAEGRHSAASCGLEIVSPEGVAARACVLTRGVETWARAYYRNATGHRLPVSLALYGPGEGESRVRCTMRGDGRRGVCETPRGPGAGATEPGKGASTAVAEVFAADGEPLLRADSGKRHR